MGHRASRGRRTAGPDHALPSVLRSSRAYGAYVRPKETLAFVWTQETRPGLTEMHDSPDALTFTRIVNPLAGSTDLTTVLLPGLQ